MKEWPKSQTICGVVVTYFPSDETGNRLSAIAKQVDMLVVVDNSASEAIAAELERLVARLGAHLILNPRNLGIATALNQGTAIARERKADWVLYFDQDSSPFGNFREEMESVRASYSDAAPLAIVGSNYFLTGKKSPRFSADIAALPNYVLTDSVITSGSLYNTSIMSKLGPFKDEFFIDGVDIEYCWRALTNGYGVCRTTKPLLEHALGSPTYHVFLGHRLGTSNHRAFRRYFMMRNAILIVREYFLRMPRRSLHLLGVQLKWAILLCAFEKDKRRKLGFALLGLWHGLIGRMDPEPWRMLN